MAAVILLCGGQQQRLFDLGYPKQLIRVAGEPILARTARLVRSLMSDVEIYVAAAADGTLSGTCREHDLVECVVPHEPMLLNVQRVMESQGLEQATVFLGDVCWSRSLLAKWLDECSNRSTLFCARLGPSAVTGKAYSEHFAIHCTLSDLHRLDARRFFRLEDAARTNVFGAERLVAQPEGDFTEDFDTQEDVQRLVPLLSALVLEEAA